MTREEAIKALTQCIHIAEFVEESYCDCVPVEVLVTARNLLEQHEGNVGEKLHEFTLDEVAEILYESFGDDCACNFNGIDEWLPMSCAYSETECPSPKEHLGCWKQYLKSIKK